MTETSPAGTIGRQLSQRKHRGWTEDERTVPVIAGLVERVDIGGNKGEMLTTSTQDVYKRFMALLAKWQAVQYDVLDVNAPDAVKSFDADFFDFMEEIKELEQAEKVTAALQARVEKTQHHTKLYRGRAARATRCYANTKAFADSWQNA